MASEGEARAEILGRIRAANGRAGHVDAAALAWSLIPRGYRSESRVEREEILDLLEDRLRDYDAQVFRAEKADLSAAISERLRQRGDARVIVPAGFPAEMLASDVRYTVDEGLSSNEMDAMGGVLTMCTLAIAETGTLVLQGVAGQGRRAATLVPDYHLCLVCTDDVVESVPEGIARLGLTMTLPTTFVSGPSATADIEMTRIKGVHGPRFLEVILYSSGRDSL